MMTNLEPNISLPPKKNKTKYWHKAQYNLHSYLHLCHANSEMKKTNEHTSLMINECYRTEPQKTDWRKHCDSKEKPQVINQMN